MSLQAALIEGPPPTYRPASKIDAWLEGLPESERDAAETMLDDLARWNHVALAATFLEHGLDVNPVTLARYRKARARVAR